jgi:hypothetical protein
MRCTVFNFRLPLNVAPARVALSSHVPFFLEPRGEEVSRQLGHGYTLADA